MKFFKVIILVFFFFTSANLNNFVYASIKNSIIAKVGKEIITSFELENKIKVILFFSGEQLTQINIDKAKQLAFSSLINYKLKKEELKKYNYERDPDILNSHLKKVAISLNTSISKLRPIFESNKMNYDQYVDEIYIDFLWQKLIFDIYSKKINVDEKQIISELNNFIKNNKKIEEYRLSEIEIEITDKNKKEEIIKEINNQIIENGFENTAIKYSNSSTAVNKGDVGWVSAAALSENILRIIKNMKLGENSKPIIQANKIIYLKLVDNRKNLNNNELNIEKLKNDLILKKKNDLFKLYSNSYLSKKKNNTLINIK